MQRRLRFGRTSFLQGAVPEEPPHRNEWIVNVSHASLGVREIRRRLCLTVKCGLGVESPVAVLAYRCRESVIHFSRKSGMIIRSKELQQVWYAHITLSIMSRW